MVDAVRSMIQGGGGFSVDVASALADVSIGIRAPARISLSSQCLWFRRVAQFLLRANYWWIHRISQIPDATPAPCLFVNFIGKIRVSEVEMWSTPRQGWKP